MNEADLPSFVYLDGGGSIVGFVGVQPRRLLLRGRRLRAAVATKLMVARAARGSVGRPASQPGLCRAAGRSPFRFEQ